MTGVIKRTLLPKGFAIVTGDDGNEYFLHASEVRNCEWEGVFIHDGAAVTFTPSKTARGLRASGATVEVRE